MLPNEHLVGHASHQYHEAAAVSAASLCDLQLHRSPQAEKCTSLSLQQLLLLLTVSVPTRRVGSLAQHEQPSDPLLHASVSSLQPVPALYAVLPHATQPHCSRLPSMPETLKCYPPKPSSARQPASTPAACCSASWPGMLPPRTLPAATLPHRDQRGCRAADHRV